MKLSIVSPVYKAELILDELVARIFAEAEKITNNFELVLVEDGSPDNSWEKIIQYCDRYKNVKGIKLSRNFGQHYAISAGIKYSKGDVIIIMDCDLQDDPKFFQSFINEINKGNEIVFSKRINRKHGFIKSFNSWIYNKLFSLFSYRKYDVNAGSFICFTRKVGLVFSELKEKDRLYLQILKWIGFKHTVIEIEHAERFEGASSYNYYKLIKLALVGIISHSTKLLKASIVIGFILSFFSFLFLYNIFIMNFNLSGQV